MSREIKIPTVAEIMERREKKNLALRTWRKANPEKVSLYMKTWREARKEIEKKVLAEAGLK